MRNRVLAASALAVVLSACGSGGSGIPDISSPIGITSSNATGVVGTVFSGDTSGSVTTSLKNSGFSPFSASTVQKSSTEVKIGSKQLVELVADKTRAQIGGSYQPQQDVSASFCSSGSANATSSGFTQSSYPYSGSMSITFSSCVAIGGGGTLNGGFSADITVPDASSVSMSMSYDNFSVAQSGQPTMSMDGSITAAMSYTGGTSSMTITSPYIGAEYNGQYYRNFDYNYSYSADFSSTTYSIDGTFDSSELGGSMTLDTITPFVIYSGDLYPSSGEIIITGAGGTKVHMTSISNTQVDVEVDGDGDGVYESGITTYTWGVDI